MLYYNIFLYFSELSIQTIVFKIEKNFGNFLNFQAVNEINHGSLIFLEVLDIVDTDGDLLWNTRIQ